jgi:hypothetical protein
MSVIQSVLVIGLILVALAVSLQVSRRERPTRVPEVAMGVLGGLATGVVMGMVLLAYYGDEWDPLGTGASLLEAPVPAAEPGSAPRGGPGRGPMGPATKAAPSSTAPNPKTQLAALVAKLDQLVERPIAVTLDDRQRAKLREALDGVDKPAELSRDEAKARLDAIQELLRDQRPALEAAGYRWPESGGGGMVGVMGPSDPMNPFHETGGSRHLRSLRERLGSEAQ